MKMPLTCLALLAVLSACVFAQDATAPKPAESSAVRKTEGLNAEIMAARKATAEKRFADSEALMLPITEKNPNLILPWAELGLAQLGLKKYSDAENDFK